MLRNLRLKSLSQNVIGVRRSTKLNLHFSGTVEQKKMAKKNAKIKTLFVDMRYGIFAFARSPRTPQIQCWTVNGRFNEIFDGQPNIGFGGCGGSVGKQNFTRNFENLQIFGICQNVREIPISRLERECNAFPDRGVANIFVGYN